MLLINCFNILFVFIASQEGHSEVVELLLNKNASVNEKTNDGWTALHMGMLIIEIFYKMLLINCLNILFVFIASENGHTKVVELLLNKNVSVNEKDNNGMTALHWGMLLIEIFYKMMLIN